MTIDSFRKYVHTYTRMLARSCGQVAGALVRTSCRPLHDSVVQAAHTTWHCCGNLVRLCRIMMAMGI